MSANADYGVSIVESFTPPKNWLPGQTVNKDVYAVNTGSIDAFVKEDITGKISYTYEVPAEYSNGNIALLKTKGVKLNDNEIEAIDGATTMEGGSILAWTNTTEPTGAKSSARINDTTTATTPGVVSNRWTPTQSGVYIFRRSVAYNDTTKENEYTYAGYYYDADVDEYYEIRIGNDVDPEHKGANDEWRVSSNSLGDGVKVDENGIVLTTGNDPETGEAYKIPTVQLVFEEEQAPTDAEFTFDKPNNRLIVTKATTPANTSTDTGVTYDASATAARAEIDYLNAKGVSDTAIADYNQVKYDFDYATALRTARNTLVDAATTRRTKYNEYYTAQTNNTSAGDAVKTAAGTLKTTYVTPNNAIANTTATPDIAPASIVPAAVVTKLTAAGAQTDYPDSYQNYQDMLTLWNEMYGTGGLASKIATEIDYLTADHTAAEVEASVQKLIRYTTDLHQSLADYKEKFANIVADTTLGTVK